MVKAVPSTSNTKEKDPVEALIKSVRIPPRPSLLLELQQEINAKEPSQLKIGAIISRDVGMSGALLKLANSPFYGLRRKAKSVDQAVTILGMNQCIALMAGLLAKQAVGGDDPKLSQFWDDSSRRAEAMVFLARKLNVFATDVAHTFGLFCNIGVPLLMARFPDYGATYALAANDMEQAFTSVEDARHATNHAAVGCLLARSWGLSTDVSWAILLHHNHEAIDDSGTEDAVRTLLSLSLLAENAIEHYKGAGRSFEWEKGGERALRHLGLASDETLDLFEQLYEMLEGG
jgi:HD-like signal output (HDOD) protein